MSNRLVVAALVLLFEVLLFAGGCWLGMAHGAELTEITTSARWWADAYPVAKRCGAVPVSATSTPGGATIRVTLSGTPAQIACVEKAIRDAR